MNTEVAPSFHAPARRARLTVLCDNVAAVAGVTPGHGLAVLVETADRRILFDTGPDDRTVANADALGLSLNDLDAIVLSHSHSDHTGGLGSVLGRTGPIPILAHPRGLQEAFVRDTDGKIRSIGPPLGAPEYAALGAQFEWAGRPRRIGREAMIPGELAETSRNSPCPGFLSRGEAGSLVEEDFRHEQTLAVLNERESLLLSGCAHPGIADFVRHVRAICPERPPMAAIGGFHTRTEPEEKLRHLAVRLHALGVRYVLPCHCTGREAASFLKRCFLGAVIGIGVGSEVDVLSDGHIDVRNPVAL